MDLVYDRVEVWGSYSLDAIAGAVEKREVMRLVDADLLSICINEARKKYLSQDDRTEWFKNYFEIEFEIFQNILDNIREATIPAYTVIQSKYGEWVQCEKELPPIGADVILCFNDTFHTHPSWPKTTVKPAWICNVDDEHPKGQWAIEGRLGNYVVEINDGIAWMPLPEPWRKS